jgi:hypothetical protein
MRIVAAVLGAAILLVVPHATSAQGTDQKPADKPQVGDGKDAQKKIDEYAEAEKLLGGPAANPECLWLGRKVVSLLYDRFGCPAGHIQATFRCVIKQGGPPASEKISDRVHACWVNPSAEMQGTAAAPSGTTNR